MTSKVLKEIGLVNVNGIGTESGDNRAGDSTSLGVGVWVNNTILNLSKGVELNVITDLAVVILSSSLNVSSCHNLVRDNIISNTTTHLVVEGSRDLNSLAWKLREKDIAVNISGRNTGHTVDDNDRAFSVHALVRDASGNSVLDQRGRVLLVGSPPGAVIPSGGDNSLLSELVALVAGSGMAVGAVG